MGYRGDYGQQQPQPERRQDPRRQPAATPPQWGQQRGPQPPQPDPWADSTGGTGYGSRQDGTRPVQPQYPQPAFTPGYRWQPQQPRGDQYAPPQPAWQQPHQQPQPQYPPQYAPQPPRQRKRNTARNVIAGTGALIAVIIVISVAANSGGHSVQTTGNTGGTTAHGGSAPKTAGIGAAITLTGDTSGEQMSVTVTKVIASAKAADEFNTAPAGDLLYAVQFRLQDTGTAAYSDAPSNGAVVIDSVGQSYDSALDNAADCQSFSATENIAPGSSGLGCIVFEVPEKAKITAVQFTLDSGMGPQTGQWHVG
jgi:hypothetical protein